MFAAATGVAFAWVANRALRARHPEWMHRPTDLMIGAAAIGMVVGRMASMVQNGVNPLTNPLDIVLVRAGVDTGFAVVGTLAALVWSTRRRIPEALDLLAPAAVSGVAGWHAGCLWRDTCVGTATDLPWAMRLPGSHVGRHPVELYAAVLAVLAAVVVAKAPRRSWVPSGIALASISLVRLATEPLRLSVVGGPVATYATGVTLGLGLAVFGAVRSRSPLTD